MINMPTKVPTRTISDATCITRFYLLSFLLFKKITLELYGFTFKNFCANAAVVYPTCLWWEGRANFIHVRRYFCTNAISQTWCCTRERAHCANACVNALEAQTCACGRSAQRFSDVISTTYICMSVYMEWRKKNLTILRLACEKRSPTRDVECKKRSSCLWCKMRKLAGIDPKSLFFMGEDVQDFLASLRRQQAFRV